MSVNIDTTTERLQALAERLGCTASDLTLYLCGYRDSMPRHESMITHDNGGCGTGHAVYASSSTTC